MTVAEALRMAGERLATVSDSPRLDAEWLLAGQLRVGRSGLLLRESSPLDPVVAQAFEAQLRRRAAGEPVAYLLGSQGFWSLELSVSPAVLIPRPETELLVEWALELLRDQRLLTPRIADLGTGSGAIGLALARELPAARVIATDASAEALAVARANARSNGIGNIKLLSGSWFGAMEGCVRGLDLIVSNPPYIAAEDAHLPALRYEPRQALVSGADGLEDLRQIVGGAGPWLRSGGWLLVEHGYDQAAAVTELFRVAGFEEIETRQDLGGQDRVTAGQWR